MPAGYFCCRMFFSKSFGYALRATLYLAAMNNSKPLIRLEEIAQNLGIPRHFLAKILKRLAKEGMLVSVKGPHGGFGTSRQTLQLSLLKMMEFTGQPEKADACVLLPGKCDKDMPCALHNQAASLKNDWMQLLSKTTIELLLKKEAPAALQGRACLASLYD